MGFLGGKKKKAPQFTYTPEALKQQGRLISQAAGAMDTGSLVPESLQASMDKQSIAAINKGFDDSTYDLNTFIARMIPDQDSKARTFMQASMSAGRNTALDDFRRTSEVQKGINKGWGLNAAMGQLGAAQEVGMNAMGMYNRTQQEMQAFNDQYGNPTSNFLGSMAPYVGDTLASVKFGRGMSQTVNTGFGPLSKSGANTVMKYGTLNPTWEQKAGGMATSLTDMSSRWMNARIGGF